MAYNPLPHVIKRLKAAAKKDYRSWDELDKAASREGAAIAYMKEEAPKVLLGRFLVRNAASPTFKSPKSMQGNRGYC